MAALPSPTQVAGSHTAIYEAYYNQVDPNGYGRIEAMDAARFLKKSQLSDVILSKIWDMADPQSRGSLDKSGLFVALKLCALAQTGKDLNMSNLNLELPPPKMGDIPAIPQKIIANALPIITSINNGDWSINPTERAKYDQLFDSLQPSNGYISGNKVKGVLMDSKLPLDTLGKIWDLADMDKDGMLDRHEFVVAMHLVYKALEKYAIPSILPPELMPPGKRKDIMPKATSPIPINIAAISTASISPSLQSSSIPSLPNTTTMKSLTALDAAKTIAQVWVVSAEDQIASEKLFLQADMDRDGFVSGLEIKDVFLQSGLPHSVLAHIWSLCDTHQSGKLNKEQFAIAMWLIKQKLNGIDPPANLTPEMVPPSVRKVGETIVENNNISGYSNPELNMISRDIAELVRERQNMEQDIAQKEADIKIKNGEIKSLQSELDTLAATLKQLGNQKGEAQKRLNDLKGQKAEVDRDLNEVEEKIQGELKKVDKLRQQAEEQESVLRTQEEELNMKRQELEGLRQEEQQLELQQNKNRDQLNELTKKLQDTQLEICQAKVKITHLQEQQRQMSDAIALYDSALAAGDVNLVPDTNLQFVPEIEDIVYETKNLNEIKESKVFSNATETNTLNEFEEQDPFAINKTREAFNTSASDPFGSAFSTTSNDGFATDPFTAFDNTNITAKQDPFDPFDNGKRIEDKTSSTTISNTKDLFGDDPFANLHAPPRPESPSPALPPKKAKQPPPRPAPPRPTQGPTGLLRAAPAPPTPSPTPDTFVNANSDPFSAQQTTIDNNNLNFTSSTEFADFTNFDSKPELTSNRTTPSRPMSRNHAALEQLKLSDFTEDPFQDYRYEDLFNITDPFADEIDDLNRNKNSKPDQTDPFGFGTISTFSNKNVLVKSFDSDFTNMLTKGKVEKDGTNKFNIDFEKALFSNNRNVRSIETDFSQTFANIKTKTTNLDEAFSAKSTKTIMKHESDVKRISKSNIIYNDEKFANDFSKVWNGNNVANLSEEEQVAWAEKQSMKAEEERVKRKEKEDAELALAIELSRGKSGNM